MAKERNHARKRTIKRLISLIVVFSIIFVVFGMMKDLLEERQFRIFGKDLLSVPLIQQKPELPRGCEVTSLAMLLNYAGVDVSKMELAEKIDKVPFESNGYTGDMNEGFLGDMYSFDKPGLGVYVKPILKLAKEYLPNRIIDLTGKPIGKLYEMIDEGSPVWVIANAKFEKLPDSEFKTFYTKNGEMKVTYWEHSVVITGYNNEYVYINDPLAHTPNTEVNRKNFEEAWLQMGSQAISVEMK